MKRHIHTGFVAGMLLASGIAQAANQINDTEINNPIGYAQRIAMPSGSAEISAWIGNATGTDVDYYTFYATEGDVLTFDIDGGMGGAQDVDTVMAIFNVSNNYKKETDNDDPRSVDPGSTSISDARIENFRVPTSGYYVVGVSGYPHLFNSGGSIVNPSSTGPNSNGDYKLVISGATPQVQQINIEIKPGSDALAPINPRSNGKIPVALLSSSEFDAMNVKTESLTFGATGDENSRSHCSQSGEDVNGDGRLDLVCHFENQKAGFAKGDTEGIVRGKMKWGTSFEGRGFLKAVPEKRGS
jgi:hypothetical protein